VFVIGPSLIFAGKTRVYPTVKPLMGFHSNCGLSVANTLAYYSRQFIEAIKVLLNRPRKKDFKVNLADS
jgi:hypothetical protein